MSVRDVCWPRAQALLTGNNPDLDYWSCWSIFSLMGWTGQDRAGQGGRGGLPSSSHARSEGERGGVRGTRLTRARRVRPGRAWLGLVASRLASPCWEISGDDLLQTTNILTQAMNPGKYFGSSDHYYGR